jgi:hypothetical protein
MQLEDLPLSFPLVGLLIYCVGYYLSWLSAPTPPKPKPSRELALVWRELAEQTRHTQADIRLMLDLVRYLHVLGRPDDERECVRAAAAHNTKFQPQLLVMAVRGAGDAFAQEEKS